MSNSLRESGHEWVTDPRCTYLNLYLHSDVYFLMKLRSPLSTGGGQTSAGPDWGIAPGASDHWLSSRESKGPCAGAFTEDDGVAQFFISTRPLRTHQDSVATDPAVATKDPRDGQRRIHTEVSSHSIRACRAVLA